MLWELLVPTLLSTAHVSCHLTHCLAVYSVTATRLGLGLAHPSLLPPLPLAPLPWALWEHSRPPASDCTNCEAPHTQWTSSWCPNCLRWGFPSPPQKGPEVSAPSRPCPSCGDQVGVIAHPYPPRCLPALRGKAQILGMLGCNVGAAEAFWKEPLLSPSQARYWGSGGSSHMSPHVAWLPLN